MRNQPDHEASEPFRPSREITAQRHEHADTDPRCGNKYQRFADPGDAPL
jgi:hypothetical protein